MTDSSFPPPSSPDDEDDRTVQRPRTRRPVGSAGVNLTTDDGRVHSVAGMALIGRSPTATSADGAVSLIVIDDDTRSLSKTHAMVRFHEGRLWVVDRGSTNGTAISGPSGTGPVGIDAWEQVFAGEYLMFGDRWCLAGDALPARPSETPIGSAARSVDTHHLTPTGLSGSDRCVKCGAALVGTEAFCTACGSVVRRANGKAEPSMASPPPAPHPTPIAGASSTMMADPTPPSTPTPAVPAPPAVAASVAAIGPEVRPNAVGSGVPKPATSAIVQASVSQATATPIARKPIPKGREGRKIRKVLRARARAQASAAKQTAEASASPPKKRRGRRVLTAAATLAVLCAGGFAAYELLLADDDTASALPALATSVDAPVWTVTLEGIVGGPVSNDGDLFVTGRSATSVTASLKRLADDDGSTLWTTEVGEGSAYVEAVVDGHVLVSLITESGGARVLHSFDVETGDAEWDESLTFEGLQVFDGRAYLVAPSEVQLLDADSGTTESITGETVVINEDFIVALRDSELFGYDLASMEQSFGPTRLPGNGLYGGSDRFYSRAGEDIVVSDTRGNEEYVVTPRIGQIGQMTPLGDDRMLVVGDRIYVVEDAAGVVEPLYSIGSWLGVVDDPSGVFLFGRGEADGDGMVVRRAADGQELFTAAFSSYDHAAGHLVIQTESELRAISLEDGAQVWSIETDGLTPTIVDGGLVTTAYSGDEDQTELAVYR